jgi:hypothetical protein
MVILLLPKERPFRELVEPGYQNGVYGVHAMSIQQNGKLSPVEFHELQRRMLEVLDLRAQIATLEKKAKSKETRERATKGTTSNFPAGRADVVRIMRTFHDG